MLGRGIAVAAHIEGRGHLLAVVLAAVEGEEGPGNGREELGLQDRATLLPLLPGGEAGVADSEDLLQFPWGEGGGTRGKSDQMYVLHVHAFLLLGTTIPASLLFP